ncbi:unnamed protein product [Vitrella brassicaformis CCMP3155]|uniref:Uncharacterized protein n=5 Tax=Vitrella brassicaformis TaxID=1169539 RepID=A0A0G4E9H4_VITBC|nr:unnamed protein product [Vitrella brassicaformis CCMP3155]|eukprot:CEL91879.1 unnamed protein product [Vitrella brassicaformis CCMP3155]
METDSDHSSDWEDVSDVKISSAEEGEEDTRVLIAVSTGSISGPSQHYLTAKGAGSKAARRRRHEMGKSRSVRFRESAGGSAASLQSDTSKSRPPQQLSTTLEEEGQDTSPTHTAVTVTEPVTEPSPSQHLPVSPARDTGRRVSMAVDFFQGLMAQQAETQTRISPSRRTSLAPHLLEESPTAGGLGASPSVVRRTSVMRRVTPSQEGDNETAGREDQPSDALSMARMRARRVSMAVMRRISQEGGETAAVPTTEEPGITPLSAARARARRLSVAPPPEGADGYAGPQPFISIAARRMSIKTPHVEPEGLTLSEAFGGVMRRSPSRGSRRQSRLPGLMEITTTAPIETIPESTGTSPMADGADRGRTVSRGPSRLLSQVSDQLSPVSHRSDQSGQASPTWQGGLSYQESHCSFHSEAGLFGDHGRRLSRVSPSMAASMARFAQTTGGLSESTKKKLHKKLQRLRSGLSHTTKRRHALLKETNLDFENRMLQLEKENKDLIKENDLLIQGAQKLQQKMESLVAENEEIYEELFETERENEVLRDDLVEVEKALAETETKVGTLQVNQSEAEDQITSLSGRVQELEEELFSKNRPKSGRSLRVASSGGFSRAGTSSDEMRRIDYEDLFGHQEEQLLSRLDEKELTVNRLKTNYDKVKRLNQVNAFMRIVERFRARRANKKLHELTMAQDDAKSALSDTRNLWEHSEQRRKQIEEELEQLRLRQGGGYDSSLEAQLQFATLDELNRLRDELERLRGIVEVKEQKIQEFIRRESKRVSMADFNQAVMDRDELERLYMAKEDALSEADRQIEAWSRALTEKDGTLQTLIDKADNLERLNKAKTHRGRFLEVLRRYWRNMCRDLTEENRRLNAAAYARAFVQSAAIRSIFQELAKRHGEDHFAEIKNMLQSVKPAERQDTDDKKPPTFEDALAALFGISEELRAAEEKELERNVMVVMDNPTDNPTNSSLPVDHEEDPELRRLRQEMETRTKGLFKAIENIWGVGEANQHLENQIQHLKDDILTHKGKEQRLLEELQRAVDLLGHKRLEQAAERKMVQELRDNIETLVKEIEKMKGDAETIQAFAATASKQARDAHAALALLQETSDQQGRDTAIFAAKLTLAKLYAIAESQRLETILEREKSKEPEVDPEEHRRLQKDLDNNRIKAEAARVVASAVQHGLLKANTFLMRRQAAQVVELNVENEQLNKYIADLQRDSAIMESTLLDAQEALSILRHNLYAQQQDYLKQLDDAKRRMEASKAVSAAVSRALTQKLEEAELGSIYGGNSGDWEGGAATPVSARSVRSLPDGTFRNAKEEVQRLRAEVTRCEEQLEEANESIAALKSEMETQNTRWITETTAIRTVGQLVRHVMQRQFDEEKRALIDRLRTQEASARSFEAEAKKTIEGLEHQRQEAARDHKKVLARTKELETALEKESAALSTAIEEMERLRTSEEALTESNEQMTSEISDLKQKLAEGSAALASADEEYNRRLEEGAAALTEARDKIERLEKEKAEADVTLDGLERERAEVGAMVDRLEREKAEVDETLTETREKLAEALDEQERTKQALELATAAVKSLEERSTTGEGSLSKALQDLQASREENNRLEREQKSLKDEIAALTEKGLEDASALASVRDQLESLNKIKEALEKREGDTERSVQTLTEKLETVVAELEEESKELATAQGRIATLETQLKESSQQASASLAALQEELREKTTALEEAKKTIEGLEHQRQEAAKSHDEVLARAKELESALEKESAAQAAAVEEMEKLRASEAALKESSQGMSETISDLKQKLTEGSAALASADEEYNRRLEEGTAALTEARDKIERLEKEKAEAEATVEDLNETLAKGTTALNEARQRIEHLEHEVAQLNSRLEATKDETQAEVEKLRTENTKAVSEEERLEKELQIAQEAAESGQRYLEELQKEKDDLEEQSGRLAQELRRGSIALTEATQRAEKAEEECVALESTQQEILEKVTRLEALLARETSALAAKTDDLTEAQREAGFWKERQHEAMAKTATLSEEAEKAKADLAAAQRELKRLRDDSDTQAAKRNSLAQSVSTLSENLRKQADEVLAAKKAMQEANEAKLDAEREKERAVASLTATMHKQKACLDEERDKIRRLESANHRLEAQSAEIPRLEQQYQDSANRLTTLSEQLGSERKAAEAARKAKDDLQRDRNQLAERLEHETSALESARAKLDQMRREKAEVEAKDIETSSKMASLKAQLEGETAALEEAREEARAAKERQEELLSQDAQNAVTLAEMTEKLHKQAEGVAAAERALHQAEEERDRLAGQHKDAADTIEELTKEVKSATEALRKAEEGMEAIAHERDVLSDKLAQLEKDKGTPVGEAVAIQDGEVRLREVRSVLKNHRSALSEARREMEDAKQAGAELFERMSKALDCLGSPQAAISDDEAQRLKHGITEADRLADILRNRLRGHASDQQHLSRLLQEMQTSVLNRMKTKGQQTMGGSELQEVTDRLNGCLREAQELVDQTNKDLHGALLCVNKLKEQTEGKGRGSEAAALLPAAEAPPERQQTDAKVHKYASAVSELDEALRRTLKQREQVRADLDKMNSEFSFLKSEICKARRCQVTVPQPCERDWQLQRQGRMERAQKDLRRNVREQFDQVESTSTTFRGQPGERDTRLYGSGTRWRNDARTEQNMSPPNLAAPPPSVTNPAPHWEPPPCRPKSTCVPQPRRSHTPPPPPPALRLARLREGDEPEGIRRHARALESLMTQEARRLESFNTLNDRVEQIHQRLRCHREALQNITTLDEEDDD